MNVSSYRNIWALNAAMWILVLLAIGPIFFPLEWLFHLFPDKYPVIHRMRGLGIAPKMLWVLSGPIAIAAIYLLIRRPLLGLLACGAFAAVYLPAAIELWGKFTFGCWVTLLAVILAGIGAISAWRFRNGPKPTDG